MTAVLEIVPPADRSLQTCSPHLMPFHIKYSGPAPISTYFRPKPVPAPSFGKSVPTDAITTNVEVVSQSTSTEVTSQNTEVVTEDGEGVVNTRDVEMFDEELPETRAPRDDRFVAAFRGRAVHGTKVELPEGYTGVLLTAPGGKTSAVVSKSKVTNGVPSKRARRAARNSRRVIDVDEDVTEKNQTGGDEDNITMADDDDRPTRRLTLSSKFSSFVVWNHDIPVDEGKDEYLRALSEWTKLAAEVHRYDY